MIANAFVRRARFDEAVPHIALEHAMKSLELYRLAGERYEEAGVINNIAWIHVLRGDYRIAVTVGRQALALLEEFPTRDAHALAWDTVGRAHDGLGEYDLAIECYQKALAIHAEIPYPVHEGEMWSNLGDAYRASGRLAEARAAWLRSLEILAPDHPVIPRVKASLEHVQAEA